MGFKIRATDIGPAEAKMKRGQPTPTTIKIPISTKEIGRVRESDKDKNLLEAIDYFYKREDYEDHIGIPSQNEFSLIKDQLIDMLGEKISCKLNLLDPRAQLMCEKNYSVTLLKFTIPVLKFFDLPMDHPEKDKPIRSITIEQTDGPKKKKSMPVKPLIIDSLISRLRIMKNMGADLPTRSLAEELRKDAEIRKLLASHGKEKFLTFENNEAGEISLENGDWKEIKPEESINEKMAILYVKFEREPV